MCEGPREDCNYEERKKCNEDMLCCNLWDPPNANIRKLVDSLFMTRQETFNGRCFRNHREMKQWAKDKVSASACEKVAIPSNHPKKEELEKADKTLVSSGQLQE